jgi:hypothetical protein
MKPRFAGAFCVPILICAFAAFTLPAAAETDPPFQHQWSKRYIGSTVYDYDQAIAVDGSGNVVIAGYFQGTTNFGGGI